MRLLIWTALSLFVVAGLAPAMPVEAAEGATQPVFLLCPHHKKYSAWSVVLKVDPADPAKVLGLALEKLTKQNSEDLAPNGYEAVLKAQFDPKTPREVLGTLDAKDFGKEEISVKADDALHLGLTPMDGGAYRLMVSMRISADERFTIGGKDQAKRDVVLRFDAGAKKWIASAVTLLDNTGRKLTDGGPKPITGIVFPVTGTGIYTVVGVFPGGDAVSLLERGGMKEER